jgi:hypothetical protein
MADDLHQPVAQRGHGPVADRLGQGQGTEKIAEIVGQGMQLQSHRVGGKAVAGQARLGHRVLALLDVLLRGAALVVEHHQPLGRAGHVGDDQPGARIQFTGMPLDLGDDAARPAP